MQAEAKPIAGQRGKHLVWLYALAWAPYITAYGAVLRASAEGMPWRWIAGSALANGLPPALLGWGVLQWGARLASPPRRSKFWWRHLGGLCLYAVAGLLGTLGLFRVFHRLDTGSWSSWSDFSLSPLLWQLFLCSLIYAVLAGLGHTLALREQLLVEETRLARARELAARSQLEALRARFDPHFLFNTLHSLLSLVRRDPTAAEEGLERLGDLLHYALRTRGAESDEVSVQEELDFVAGYVELERLRLAQRLHWEQQVDPSALECLLPALTLQPLVENALRHAVAPRVDGGRVRLEVSLRDRDLVMQVSDDGPGADQAKLLDDEVAANALASVGSASTGSANTDPGRGQGLELVRQRLEAIYGGAATLQIRTRPGQGFQVQICLPARRGTSSSPKNAQPPPGVAGSAA